jgi:hypothetical protein
MSWSYNTRGKGVPNGEMESDTYPRRVLLHQWQLVQMIAEYRALNEWHAAYVFAKAMYGEEVSDVHIKSSGENRWNVEVTWL